MTQRMVPFLAAAAMLAIVITTTVLGLPSWIGFVGAMGAAFGVIFLFLTRQNRQRFQGKEDPFLKARVELALERIGMTGVPIVVVDGAGLPVLHVKDGELRVSPRAGELLSDPELDALALLTLSARPEIAKRESWRYYGPWVAALVIAGAVSLYTRQPWVGIVLLAFVVWTQIDIRRRTIGQRALEANIDTFLERGGNAPALLSAVVRTQSAVVRSGVNQAAIHSQLRGVLQTIATKGGIDPAELERLTGHPLVPPQLGAAGAKQARRQIWLILLFLLFILFGTFVPFWVDHWIRG